MGLQSMSNQRAYEEVKTPSNGAENVPASTMAGMISEEQFRQMLCRERKRSERSRKHLLLMLIDSKGMKLRKGDAALMGKIAGVLNETIRETDLAGWFETGSVLGVIFTELGGTDVSAAVKIIESKVTTGLQKVFKPAQLSNFQLSFYAFPDGWEGNGHGRPVDAALYPDLFEVEKKKKLSLLIKRVMDFVGSAAALIILSPACLVLAALIKLTSKGPVFFRQERVGQYGVPFVFLKFRSMQASTDATIHKEYVRNFIAGKAGNSGAKGNEKIVYKITNDPRVTWIGKIMRRTSLDELPQFWNVLTGEMSLVGPRPPIPYEIEAYDIWHRRRLLEAKPGITGLWQVYGRSKTTFDEMVRLDLQYSRTWSPLLDLKILLQTPRAVFSGDGAY
jgi:lipopolysaccharide/colanic/teichoic acid biosynthesis glycosyltransferase